MLHHKSVDGIRNWLLNYILKHSKGKLNIIIVLLLSFILLFVALVYFSGSVIFTDF